MTVGDVSQPSPSTAKGFRLFHRSLNLTVKGWRFYKWRLTCAHVFCFWIKDGCDDKGPNGAWEDPDAISFCYPNKTSDLSSLWPHYQWFWYLCRLRMTIFTRMMNVIRQKHDKAVNTWYHGSLIKTSYNFTAEYITTQAWECQLSRGIGGQNPYNNTSVISICSKTKMI